MSDHPAQSPQAAAQSVTCTPTRDDQAVRCAKRSHNPVNLSEGSRGEFTGSKVTRIVMLRNDLFGSKTEAIGIPQRACAPEDAFDHFVTYAKERVNGQAL